MNYDKHLIKILIKSDSKPHINLSTYYKLTRSEKYINIKNYLNNRYNDSFSFCEVLYRMFYNIDNKPKCPTCGKPLTFITKNKFYKYCSIKCQRNDPDNVKKYNETCLKKYGVDNPAKAKTVINKAKETCNEKYGGNSPMNSVIVRNKLMNNKRKHGTFNKSKPEEQTYELLKEKYPDTIRQYKSDVYPFNCDFYVPSLDLYIECNYHWTHGKHPYNLNNSEDKVLLKTWKTKESQFYKNAIIVWTITDVRKRNIAKQNKLNFKELWNYKEAIEYINNL